MVVTGTIGRAGIILMVLVTIGRNLAGQTSPFDPGVSGEAALIKEQVDAFTDRSLYITGEVIRFRADVRCTGLPTPEKWSSVLYVELLSASGKSVAEGKFWIHNQVSTGEIAIPPGLLTGNYFFKCYTRWMRNRNPEAYCYIPMRLINPYRPELSMGIQPGNRTDHLIAGSVHERNLKFSEPAREYIGGDSVILDLDFSGTDGPGKAEGCLTVVPAECKPKGQIRSTAVRTEGPDDFGLQLLPDRFGATLSGTVFYPDQEEQAVQDARIHFTLMGDQSAYFVARTDVYGKFSVTLPNREGKLELLVLPESPGDTSLVVRIDQDFDQREVYLPAEPFSLSLTEKQLVTTMARKVQLAGIYGEMDSLMEAGIQVDRVPFYGLPTFSLNMDDFVLLPTLEEVLINLVPDVSPVTRKKRAFLAITSENPTLSMFDPLIMIDQVPFFSMEEFFSVPTDRISNIDVVNDIYLKGDLRYGGIVNIRTTEKDMAGIDLPDNAFFIDYTGFYTHSGERSEPFSKQDKMPDTRNTLLWIPELQVEQGNPAPCAFTAPDYPGEYVVLFRGLDEKGEPVSAATRIVVR
jgi:hypothetical protein